MRALPESDPNRGGRRLRAVVGALSTTSGPNGRNMGDGQTAESNALERHVKSGRPDQGRKRR
jgi:hypothetical protein